MTSFFRIRCSEGAGVATAAIQPIGTSQAMKATAPVCSPQLSTWLCRPFPRLRPNRIDSKRANQIRSSADPLKA